MARADTPKSENFDETIPVPGSTRRTRDKKDKEKELREREKEREKERAKEVGDEGLRSLYQTGSRILTIYTKKKPNSFENKMTYASFCLEGFRCYSLLQ